MNNKTKKIFCIFMLVLVFFSFSSNVFAEINTSYGENGPVQDVAYDDSISSSSLLEAIAKLIYALGNLIENLMGGAFELLVGNNMFPWADKVIFNTIPLLDINFLNPSQGSLFLSSDGQTETILATIVRRIYFTIFAISISLLGIMVAVMAIKLAVSTIASEKAKYKEALTNWVLGIVMIFTVHYLISFLFFANEQVVKVASSMLTEQLEGVQVNITDENDQVTRFYNFAQRAGLGSEVDSSNTQFALIAMDLFDNPTYKEYGSLDPGFNILGVDVIGGDTKLNFKRVLHSARTVQNTGFMQYTSNAIETFGSGDVAGIESFLNSTGAAMMVTNYLERYEYAHRETIFGSDDGTYEMRFKIICNLIDKYRNKETITYEDIMFSGMSDALGRTLTAEDFNRGNCKAYLVEFIEFYKTYVQTYNEFVIGDGSTAGINIISEMGQFFKEAAWGYDRDSSGEIRGFERDRASITGCILYFMFVLQSILFFFSYLKRFFYIIILSIMAPIVVIYDFFMRIMAF